MQMFKTIALLLAILMMGACSGDKGSQVVGNQDGTTVPFRMSAVDGSSLAGIECSYVQEELVVTFESVKEAGQFIEFTLPEGIVPTGQEWTGNEQALSLMVHANGTAQVGVAPLTGYQGNEISVSIPLGSGSRQVSRVPTGEKNKLVDLLAIDQGDGTSRLEWSEVNRGDFDFNSEVNLADLGQLAIHFQESNILNDPGINGYWVDGDGNGEINLADLATIAINYQNTIESYTVVAPDDTIVIVPRTKSIPRFALPPMYRVVIPNSNTGTWQVFPVGVSGEEGESTEIVIEPQPDLLVDINVSGLNLFNLDGSGNFGPPGPGQMLSYLVEL